MTRSSGIKKSLAEARQRFEAKLQDQILELNRASQETGNYDSPSADDLRTTTTVLEILERWFPPKRRPWLPIALVLLPFVSVGLLMKKVDSTPIILEMSASTFGVNVSGESFIMGGLGDEVVVASLSVAGAQSIYVDDRYHQAIAANSHIEFSCEGGEMIKCPDVQRIEMPAGTVLRLRHRTNPHGLHISMSTTDVSDIAPAVILTGSATLITEGLESLDLPDRVIASSEIRGSSLAVELAFLPPTTGSSGEPPVTKKEVLAQDLPVEEIWVHRTLGAKFLGASPPCV